MAFFVGFLYMALLYSQYEKARSDIHAYASQWEYEIARNIFDQTNEVLVEKLVHGLRVFPISSYEVIVQGKSLYRWVSKPSFESSSRIFSEGSISENLISEGATCLQPVEISLTMQGLHLGKIRSCLAPQHFIQATLFSPLFISVILVMIALVIGAAIFPLLGYKKALVFTLDILKKWSQNPENKFPMEDQDRGDKVTLELVHLVKQGLDLRIDLKETQMELETEKEISKITRQVAHDILSPAMALDIAMQGNFQMPLPQMDLVRSSIQRIVDTSRDLLNPGEQSPYQMERKVRSLRLAPLVQSLIQEKQVLNKSIRFVVEIPENIKVISSPVELIRCFSNIMNNSMEAQLPPCEGLISCRAVTEGDFCRITFTDNGQGMPFEDLDKVFEEHFTRGKSSGTGLGLYYVSQKVKEWGGSIHVHSKVYQGTTLELTLKTPLELRS